MTFGPWKTKFVVCDQMGNIFIHLSQRQQEQQQQQLRKQQQESLTIFEWLFKRFGASSPRNERFKWFWANWFKLVRSWAWQGIYLFLFGCVFFSSSALRNDPLNMFATLFHCDYVTFICLQLALETTLGPLMSSVLAIITTNLHTYMHALAYI